MKFEAESVITKIVLWCTILNRKTLKSFCFVIIYQNFYIYRIEIGEVAPQSKCVRETLRFMFRSKRTSLIKRLWKLRIRNEHETSCQTEEFELEPEGCFSNTESNSEGCGCCNSRASNTEILVRTNLLKKLEEHQLEMLIQAVESKGADLSACILLPRDNAGTTAVDPHVLSCQVWRWPGLRESNQMRRLPGCRSAKDPVYTCCNPYHWSRLCQPDRAPSEGDCDPLRGGLYPGSLTTNGEGETGTREWCRLAYWELATRVGRQFSVEPESVNVFTCLPHGDGLCLATLAQTAPGPPPDAVRRTRLKIGLGVTLSTEPDGVWVYNRSENPIFVNSPTLDDPDSRTLLVYRVPSGHCLNIFDRTKPNKRIYYRSNCSPSGPVDPNSVRISFAKGWGPKYSRQEVTSCPCWLEVLLKAPCR